MTFVKIDNEYHNANNLAKIWVSERSTNPQNNSPSDFRLWITMAYNKDIRISNYIPINLKDQVMLEFKSLYKSLLSIGDDFSLHESIMEPIRINIIDKK